MREALGDVKNHQTLLKVSGATQEVTGRSGKMVYSSANGLRLFISDFINLPQSSEEPSENSAGRVRVLVQPVPNSQETPMTTGGWTTIPNSSKRCPICCRKFFGGSRDAKRQQSFVLATWERSCDYQRGHHEAGLPDSLSGITVRVRLKMPKVDSRFDGLVEPSARSLFRAQTRARARCRLACMLSAGRSARVVKGSLPRSALQEPSPGVPNSAVPSVPCRRQPTRRQQPANDSPVSFPVRSIGR
jgi:hypothetical protein